MESALDDTHSHVVLDPPIAVSGPPCSHLDSMSLNGSGNKLISCGEGSRRVRQKVIHPSFNILGDLLALQVCQDLLLPLERIVLSKPGKAIQSIGRGGRHGYGMDQGPGKRETVGVGSTRLDGQRKEKRRNRPGHS